METVICETNIDASKHAIELYSLGLEGDHCFEEGWVLQHVSSLFIPYPL